MVKELENGVSNRGGRRVPRRFTDRSLLSEKVRGQTGEKDYVVKKYVTPSKTLPRVPMLRLGEKAGRSYKRLSLYHLRR